MSICRAGQYLFYRQFISAKKEGGIIFSCGLLIFTSRTYIKHTHYLPGGGGGGGAATYIYQKLFEAGCVGT